MTEPTSAVQTTRGLGVIFIHSSLDDAGLSCAQFRVFAHLCRRAGDVDGICWAAASSMAEICRLNKDTVWQALAELERRSMIERRARPGDTTQWVITAPHKWLLNPEEKRGRLSEHPAEKEGRGVAEKEGRGVAEKRGHEGNPRRISKEGNPRRSKFIKPRFDEMEFYAGKIGLPATEINKFFDYHESKGWVVGRSPMRCWQAAMRTWVANARSFAFNGNGNGKPPPLTMQQRSDLEENRRLKRLAPEEYAEMVAAGKMPDV